MQFEAKPVLWGLFVLSDQVSVYSQGEFLVAEKTEETKEYQSGSHP